ncbi:MAG TPA: pyridoxamine 5'-phosphate oxidase family protein [Candidatus Limnocylindrales bacterium]
MTFTADQRVLLAEARRATLATIGDDGRPRLMPICFVVVDDVVWSPLDEKPKAVRDVRGLARVRDIMARPDVSLLVDRWSEDWSELAWLRIGGRATVVEPDDVPPAVITALRAKHPQYRDHDLEHRPALRIEVANTAGWPAREG